MGDFMQDTAQADIHHGHRWIWFVTGPTACGKTTVAKALAADLYFTFVEGDDVCFDSLPMTRATDKAEVPPQSQRGEDDPW